jgi:hypothetical protein
MDFEPAQFDEFGFDAFLFEFPKGTIGPLRRSFTTSRLTARKSF